MTESRECYCAEPVVVRTTSFPYCDECGRYVSSADSEIRSVSSVESEIKSASQSDDFTDLLRHSGRVMRYHTWAVHHHQSVGEHCWQVARIYEHLWGEISRSVEKYIRHHDSAELVVGDPPFPTKSTDPMLKAAYDSLEAIALVKLDVELPKLTPTERARVKVCDLLEMMEHGMTEREMGNLLAVPIVLRTEIAALEHARQHLSPLSAEWTQVYVEEQWNRHLRVLRAGSPEHGYGPSRGAER